MQSRSPLGMPVLAAAPGSVGQPYRGGHLATPTLWLAFTRRDDTRQALHERILHVTRNVQKHVQIPPHFAYPRAPTATRAVTACGHRSASDAQRPVCLPILPTSAEWA